MMRSTKRGKRRNTRRKLNTTHILRLSLAENGTTIACASQTKRLKKSWNEEKKKKKQETVNLGGRWNQAEAENLRAKCLLGKAPSPRHASRRHQGYGSSSIKKKRRLREKGKEKSGGLQGWRNPLRRAGKYFLSRY